MTVAAPSANGGRSSSRPAPPRPNPRPPSALELIRSADHTEEAPPEAGSALQAQPSGFSPEQLAALSAPLDRANVRQREQGRSRVSYLEGWQVIAEANRIFGFDGWQRQTIAVRCVADLWTLAAASPAASCAWTRRSTAASTRPASGCACRPATQPQ